MTDERFTALPTAEEYTLFREAYAETYPVRPLLNAIDAKDAEIKQLRSVALAARALVQSAHDFLARDDFEETAVSEPALTALESALEAAGYGMTDEELERHVEDETKPLREMSNAELAALGTEELVTRMRAAYDSAMGALAEIVEAGEIHDPLWARKVALKALRGGHETSAAPGPQLCSCRDGARYRFIRQGEDRLDTLAEEILAAVWKDIGFKGCWRERMDKRIDDAMQQLKQP